jgi:hypothetical protein
MSSPHRTFAPPSGSADAFAAFHRLVTNDAELFARLQNASSTEAFVGLVIELGAQRGLNFEAEDVREVIHAARRAWIERNVRGRR